MTTSQAGKSDVNGINSTALADWLDNVGFAGHGDVPVLEELSGGSQNELFVIRRGEDEAVIRMLPGHAGPDRAKGLAREYRLLEALRDTDVPHARVIGGCLAPSGVGAPFYMMERIDGWSIMQNGGWPAPFDQDLALRPQLATELVDGIARLARVDWRAVGLTGFGKPEGFHDRQVDRWLAHLDTYKFRDLPGLDAAASWLRRHRPRAYVPGIMHGDYQFANVIFQHGAPGKLAAIIDWEMTTVGDPLLDLGWALIGWPPEGSGMLAVSYIDYTGMPVRDDVLRHYETVSGRATDDIDYYVILARFKLGIILEGSVARQRQGGDARAEKFDMNPMVLDLIARAADLASQTK